jgi:sporulation protein YlmC with PRC-barrel domain
MTATRPEFPESIEDRLPTEETAELIASDKVEGTAVFDGRGEKIGHVHNFMVDKRSGQVVYAVMSFGGFLGIGEKYHPLPWKVLRYDEKLGGYEVGLDMGKIKEGPSYDRGREPVYDRAYYGAVYGYYGI